MDGSSYANTDKLLTLLGPSLLEQLRGKDVLDFGCGVGMEAVRLAAVARSVHGLDIMPRYLAEARERARIAGVDDRVAFGTEPPERPVDVIVSLDSFEHFGDPAGVLATMYELLRPGGQVVFSFGPTWFHPLGGHLFSVFPWAHLLFSESALCLWRARFKSDGAKYFRDVEGGLNQMTIRRFERLVAASPFRRTSTFECVPIRPLRRVYSRLTREWTTAIVRGSLTRASNT